MLTSGCAVDAAESALPLNMSPMCSVVDFSESGCVYRSKPASAEWTTRRRRVNAPSRQHLPCRSLTGVQCQTLLCDLCEVGCLVVVVVKREVGVFDVPFLVPFIRSRVRLARDREKTRRASKQLLGDDVRRVIVFPWCEQRAVRVECEGGPHRRAVERTTTLAISGCSLFQRSFASTLQQSAGRRSTPRSGCARGKISHASSPEEHNWAAAGERGWPGHRQP